MPLFGSSSNDNKLEKRTHPGNELGTTGTGAGIGHDTHEMYPATGGMGQSGMGQSGMGQPGMAQPGMGQPGMGQTGMGEPGMGAMGGQHHGHHAGGMRDDGMMADPQYGAGMGAGTGTGMGAGNHAGMGAGNGAGGIPPAGTLNHGNQGGGSGKSMTGKIEHVVGSVVGSKSLKEKGILKEQEARGLKIQSQELAEAERLEQEAGMRRERAVAHGAHPDNRHVGGMGPGGTAGGNIPGAYD
ncbi:hypothetical protein DFH06DRAFT_1295167 [Mycena polygramma]|nr:hypothetical protein DFH06DRAFT_1295167 [Mycena polygramma]